MVSPNQPITLADVKALATLANTKLAPSTPYAFPEFSGSDVIASPPDIKPVATYGIGSFADGAKVSFWLFGYKTIAGTKTFTWTPLVKAFKATAGSGNFSLTWTWVSTMGITAPDGYIAVIPLPSPPGWTYAWQDIGNVQTFTEDGTFSNPAWKFDETLDANSFGNPVNSLPCAHGIWLKMLNTIRNDTLGKLSLFGGATPFTDSFLLSGPWCVSVAPKCYLKLSGTSIYKNLKFIYSEADSVLGNELASESDMADYIGAVNGANNFTWDANVSINGTIRILSEPPGQNPGDWNLTASHPGIAISFDPHYLNKDVNHPLVTAFVFTFTNVQFTVGTAVVLTCTPLSGGSVINPGNQFGNGGLVNAVFTGDKNVYSTTDTTAIHYAGKAAKSAALPNTLAPITITLPCADSHALESHHRSFCNGVFVANTLPTMGQMPYLDVDLPQYNPRPPGFPASSRRVPVNGTLPFIASVSNRGALWPVFRDADFIPDSMSGQPVTGSKAWNVLGTKFAIPNSVTDLIPPSGISGTLFNYSVFVLSGCVDVRFYANDPNVKVYIRANALPTLSTFDAIADGGAWFSLAASIPGFQTNTIWFYSIYNPTNAALKATTATVLIKDVTPPNGTFFPTLKDDSGNDVPQLEGYSYHFPDPESNEHRPIPMYGYCVSSFTVRRVEPSTAALDVKIGLKLGFGFDTAGVFSEIQTVTIPAGQTVAVANVFLPVLSGTPLDSRCAESVVVICAVNFQPMMHSSFSVVNTKVNGNDYPVGYYNGPSWYQPNRALLFFIGGDFTAPIELPASAAVYNDVESTLNLL